MKPLSFDERDVFEHARAVLSRLLPAQVGSVTIALADADAATRALFHGQTGAVRYDDECIVSGFELRGEGLASDETTRGQIWVCDRDEHDGERVARRLEAWVNVVRRALDDPPDGRMPTAWKLANLMRPLHAASARSTATVQGCEKVILASRDARGTVRPPRDAERAMVAALDPWLDEHTELARGGRAILLLVASGAGLAADPVSPRRVETTDAGLRITAQFVVYDANGSVWDIKEQWVVLVAPEQYDDPPRAIACLDAWSEVLSRALAGPLADQYDCLMPHDLFPESEWKLKSPRTREDYVCVFERRWKLAPAG